MSSDHRVGKHNIYPATQCRLSQAPRRPLVVRVCVECGAEFLTERRRLSDPKRGQFCSRSCKASRENRGRTGERNHCWKGGVSKDGYRYAKRFRARFPDKYRSQQIAQRAIQSGRLVRPETCSACGVACKPHGHHDDYTRPLDVRWLCRSCHIAHHAAERRAQANLDAVLDRERPVKLRKVG